LHDAGRLDIVYECIVASLFLSHAIRKDVVFHAVLNGPPSPPVHLRIDGDVVHDVRTDLQTWQQILKKMLSGGAHSGITVSRSGFEALLKGMVDEASVYVLEEGGKDIADIDVAANSVFVLGDHIGLPRKVEAFALRRAQKVSLGKRPYLAASCITVLNYLLDKRENLL
jgi:tRNA (pseudouridine54-N1)-methyltransferase